MRNIFQYSFKYPVNEFERTGVLTVMPLTKHQKEQAISAVEHYRFIRSIMVALGVTNAHIARDENVSHEYVYYVLKGKRKGYRIRRAISKAVNQPVKSLWPDTPWQHCETAPNA